MRIASVILVLFVPVAVSARDDVFTPGDVAKLRVVTEAVISPDGNQVAYVLAVPRGLSKEKDGPPWTELHLVDADGKSTPIIAGPVNVGKIAWTPDGKEIAFLAKREHDPTRCLYAIGARGGESRKLVAHPTDVQGYSFSGEGDEVAFLATEPLPITRKKLREQGFKLEVYEEDQPFVHVYVCSLGNSPHARAELPRMIKLNGSASQVQFNPQANEIAVVLAPAPTRDELRTSRHAYIVSLWNSRAAKVEFSARVDQIAWSPDGKMLGMLADWNRDGSSEGGTFVFFGIRGRQVLRFRYSDRYVSRFSSFGWESPTKFWSQATPRTVSLFGHHQFQGDSLTPISQFVRPWLGQPILSHITVSSRGKSLAFIGHNPRHPPEVYYTTIQKFQPRRLTDSNPWLKKMRFAEQEVIRYKAGDGLNIKGILMRPLNEEKGKRYPLIVAVHDGPAAHYSNGWLTSYHELGQVAAAKGITVFYPNYRGSTGYGPSFVTLNRGDAGGNEFYDIIDGVRHLVDSGLVDKNKVGIMGSGYGGYGAAWGATYYSEHFAAAAMFGGISDWVSCSGTTDVPHELFHTRHRKWLWEDWDYFTRISPIKYVGKAKTPLLIAHGKADSRINPGQSLELYRHLKTRGQAPVRLILYPGENHELRRTASRLDYNTRLLRWMEHYLKGPGGAIPAMTIDYGLQRGD